MGANRASPTARAAAAAAQMVATPWAWATPVVGMMRTTERPPKPAEMVSPFTPIIYFGVLNIVTILFATLGTLLLLGAVILVLQPRFLLRGAALSQTPLPELQPRAVKSDAQEA